jgi:hypothetical protein
MRRPILIILAAGCALYALAPYFAASVQSSPQNCQHPEQNCPRAPGAIQGLVTDAEGNPVAGALVQARLDRGSAGAAVFVATTNNEGRFSVGDIPPGAYRVYATTGKDDLSFVFFYGEPWTAKVTVYEQQVAEGVALRVNTELATLTARAIDAKTGRPVNNAYLLLTRADNPKQYLGTGANRPDGKFHLVIPAIAFRIKASAPGFEDWHYSSDDSKGPSNALELAPRTSKELIISLRPIR